VSRISSSDFTTAKEKRVRSLQSSIIILGIAVSSLAVSADQLAADASTGTATLHSPTSQIAQLESRLSALEARAGQPPNLQWWPGTSFFSALAAMCSAFVAVTAFAWQRQMRQKERIENAKALDDERTTRQSEQLVAHKVKSIPITSWCVDHFYDIHERHRPNDPMYYNRLWGLHYTQFYYYRNLLLDHDMYLTWLKYLRLAYHKKKNNKLHWTRVKQEHINDTKFIGFIEQVLKCANDEHIEEILDNVPLTLSAYRMMHTYPTTRLRSPLFGPGT
jgi:hypothetical protein